MQRTRQVNGYEGDTCIGMDPALAKLPGFAELSLALDACFLMEDALTSGYNDYCNMDPHRSHALGATTNAFRGPGSLKSKAKLREDRETTPYKGSVSAQGGRV